MQDKHKVTLYLPNDLHRQLKIRSAVDGEAMSALAERAINFYLSNSDVVDGAEGHGQTHRVYDCPQCSTAVVLRDGELAPVTSHDAISHDDVHGETMTLEELSDLVADPVRSGEGELVPC
ncbi:MAG: hypothetical protein AAF152_08890 [Cyanobacteria bacterium P01_A01_bin.114]